jgi:hypothetical protein
MAAAIMNASSRERQACFGFSIGAILMRRIRARWA